MVKISGISFDTMLPAWVYLKSCGFTSLLPPINDATIELTHREKPLLLNNWKESIGKVYTG